MIVPALFIFTLFGAAFSVDPRCSGVPTGQRYLFPYPSDCARYIECTTTGDAVVHSCTGDEWFNEALQSCDHKDSSGCIPLTCPPGVVDYYAYPSDCTRYIECYRGTAEVHACSGDFYFNAAEKRCVSEEQSNCGEYATTISPPWTVPSDTTCYGVLPGQIELKPYPGDCRLIIECIGRDYTILYCPNGFYFDADRQLCDQPELAHCDATTGSPDPGVTNSPVTVAPFEDPRCANGNNDYWPDVECSQYVECYEGHGYMMSCPSGLYYNSSDKKCEDPSVSDCGRVTSAPDPGTTVNPNPDADCVLGGTYYNYLFPYPGDCTKFMECITGEKIVQDCPEGLWFNAGLEVCDFPEHSGCIPGV